MLSRMKQKVIHVYYIDYCAMYQSIQILYYHVLCHLLEAPHPIGNNIYTLQNQLSYRKTRKRSCFVGFFSTDNCVGHCNLNIRKS